jgi:hypothetical protein
MPENIRKYTWNWEKIRLEFASYRLHGNMSNEPIGDSIGDTMIISFSE